MRWRRSRLHQLQGASGCGKAKTTLAAAWRMPAVLRYSLLFIVPFLFPMLAFIGCGASPLPITHRPASELRLEINIINQYKKDAGVYVQVRAFDGVNERGVAFADKASLTCDGVNIKAQAAWKEAGAGSCPRQPPGGAYTFIYTDEHGASTTVTVPVSVDAFSILSPAPNSPALIPTNGALSLRVSLPALPNGNFTVGSITASVGSYPNTYASVSAAVQDDATPTITPTARNAGYRGLASLANDRARSATPTPPATPTQGYQPPTPTPGDTQTPSLPPPPASATMTRDGANGIITLRGDFSQFFPGDGEVALEVRAQETLDAGGFAAATATVESERISFPITWAR